MNMMTKMFACLSITLLSGMLSCSSHVKRTPSFTVKGTVATGAHTRTPLSGGHLEVFAPGLAKWTHVGYGIGDTRYEASTDSAGSYEIVIYVSALDAYHYPVFLAVSDSAQTFTMLAELPADVAVDGANLVIDINPVTTVASQMICPGGVYPPPNNAWCYSDPKTPSVDNTGMLGLLGDALGGTEIALETGTPPAWGPFAAGFLNDPPTFDAIKKNLTAQGIDLGAATPASIAAAITAAPLPLVSGSATSGGTKNDAGTTTGGGTCKLVWDCGASAQCAAAYGAKTGSDASTCQSVCKSQGACSCQGC